MRVALFRFIPACAGNAKPRGSAGRALPVHPRVCGERAGRPRLERQRDGSSPRVRGTLSWGLSRCPLSRFIPACAGNARLRRTFPTRSTVHPRVCGERDNIVIGAGRFYGSSPRVRGTPRDAGFQSLRRRFIPACAGNARRAAPGAETEPVHPRVCGERLPRRARRAAHVGSSPRVRGTRTATPADDPRPPVHPRVCGERGSSASRNIDASGSSPRVRGTRQPVREVLPEQRFIPACAGNAADSLLSTRISPVHPRVCGERSSRTRAAWTSPGSSPRVRGTRDRAEARLSGQRFIPACAGNA